MKVEQFRRMHTRAGKGSIFNKRKRNGLAVDIVKRPKQKESIPDPRYKEL